MGIEATSANKDNSAINNIEKNGFTSFNKNTETKINDIAIIEELFSFNPTAADEKQLVNKGQIRQAALLNINLSPSVFDYDQIAGLNNNPNVTPAFISEVEAMSALLGAKPEHILAAMSFETGGTFSPSIQNGIGATGLIQFIPSTARGLGTTTDALKRMNSVEQLRFVEKYFEPFKGRLDTLEKVYTSILSGSPKSNPDDVLFRRGTRAYEQNPLDWNKDGVITAQEATTPVTARMFGGIRAVQQKLLDGNFVTTPDRPGFADARWGSKTAAALKNFQRANGLPATGNLDEATGRRLFNLPNTPTPIPTNPPTNPSSGAIPNAGLTRGSRGEEVEKLQNLLIRFGEMTEAQKATGSGIFGLQTQSAVQDFQRNTGINPTGTFDNATRNAMQKILGGVRKGERSALVERMQDRLVQMGFMTARQKATGPGIFGSQTKAALEQFQRRNGLGVDGIFGPRSYKALFGAVNGGGTPMPNTNLYTTNPGVSITNQLAPKLERLARAYQQQTGQTLHITSGYRPPSRQSSAMASLIQRRGETHVRNLYRNKTAVNEIINAYNRGGVNEMTRVIERQVGNGIYISNHLRNNAVDVSIGTNERILRDIVGQMGGRVLNEGDHLHIELQ